jgi:hypothetical protein
MKRLMNRYLMELDRLNEKLRQNLKQSDDGLYDLTDAEYRKAISNVAPDLLAVARLAKDLGWLKEFPLDFAKKCRIRRTNDAHGYSGNDCDIEFVNDLLTVFERLGVL